MVTGYRFDLTCPLCGGALTHVNASRPSCGSVAAVAACVPCRREMAVLVEVVVKSTARQRAGARG
jgi:hypothetical protein